MIDVGLSSSFDTIQHTKLLSLIAKRALAQRALERLKEELEPFGVRLDPDKTRIVKIFKGESLTY